MLSSLTVLFASLLGVDECLKQYAEENIDQGEERELRGGRLVMRKVYNQGFLLNFLEEKPKIVKGVTVAAAGGILICDILTFMPIRILYKTGPDGRTIIRLRRKKGQCLRKISMTILSAGAASNIFDRLVRGRVIDYIGFKTGKKSLDRITANLGDAYIACGGLILIIRGLR